MNRDNIMQTMNTHAKAAREHATHNVGFHSATIENLHHAVTRMRPTQVEHLLHSGVNVNEPIDKEGHTVLDAFAVEHQSMLKQMASMKAENPQQITTIFYANMDNAKEIKEILQSHGAMMSSPESHATHASPYVP